MPKTFVSYLIIGELEIDFKYFWYSKEKNDSYTTSQNIIKVVFLKQKAPQTKIFDNSLNSHIIGIVQLNSRISNCLFVCDKNLKILDDSEPQKRERIGRWLHFC